MLTHNVNRITSLSVNKNRHLIAGGSWCKIWLWQIKPNYCLTSLSGHSDWVISVDISSDGSLLVSGSQDKTIQLWNLKNQRLLGIIKEHTDVVNSVLISPDQKVIISASSDKTIKIYDLATQKVKYTLNNHSQTVNCIAVSSDSKLLFTGSSDKTVKVWDLQHGKLLSEIMGFQGAITALEIHKINNKLTLMTGSSHGEFDIWQINSKSLYGNNFLDFLNPFPKKPKIKLIESFNKESSLINSIAYSKKKEEIIVCQSNGEVTYLETFDFKKQRKSKHSHINDIQFNFTGDYLIAATDYGLGLNIYSTYPTLYLPLIQKLEITITNQGKTKNDSIEVCKTKQLSVLATLINGEKISLDNNYLEWKTTVGNIDNDGILTTNDTSKTVTISVKDWFGLIELSRRFRLKKSLPYLHILTFSHFKESLELNERFCFQVQGLDQHSQPFNDFSLNWIVSRGKIDKHGNFQADNIPGEVTIKAIAKNNNNGQPITLEKTIQIVEPIKVNELKISSKLNSIKNPVTLEIQPVLFRLKIEPFIKEFKTGQKQQFKVKGYDKFNKEIPLNNVFWKATGDRINDKGYFIAGDDNADVKITVKSGNISKSIKVKVRQTLSSKKSKLPPFTSTRNQERDEIKRPLNKVNLRQKLSSNKSKSASLTSTQEKVKKTIVILPILTRLELCKKEVSLLPEQEYQFKVSGFDQFDKPIKIGRIKWKCSYGGTINQSGIFKGYDRKKIVTVTVSIDEVSTTAKVTLLPILRELLIGSKLINVKPGESQQFTVYGLDQYGDSIDPNNIYWDATGGAITQSGLFTADVCAKGEYEITATALDTPLLSTEYRNIFTYIGVSTRLTSWLISYEKLIKNILFSQEFNQQEIEEDNDTIEETDILSLSGEMFDLAMQKFINRQLRKQITRCLAQISSFSLRLAESKVSASVKVNIHPVLRSIKIEPSYQDIKQGEKCQFTMYGLDQYNDPIEINEEIKWEASGGKMNQQGLLETEHIKGQIVIQAIVKNLKAITRVNVSIQPKLPLTTQEKKQEKTSISSIPLSVNRYVFTLAVAHRAKKLPYNKDERVENYHDHDLITTAINQLKKEMNLSTDIDI
ncbi:MAG: WD40 repeat domain-containing protein [Crocosphaera sp.]